MDLSLLGFRGLCQVYNLHPVFVHFPVALLPASLLFYFLGLTRKSNSAFFAGRATLGLSAAGSIAAVITGLRAEDTIPHNDQVHRIMELHEGIGIAVLSLSAGLVVWSALRKDHRPPAAVAFVCVLGVTVLLALQNADLGGRMVFVEGAGVRATAPILPDAAVRPVQQTDTPSRESAPPLEHKHSHDHSAHKH